MLFGRETGPRFWHRFDANLAALERVVERDVMYADVLVQLAEREELCSHKLRPVLGVTLLHGLGTIPDPAGGGGPKAKPPRLIVQVLRSTESDEFQMPGCWRRAGGLF